MLRSIPNVQLNDRPISVDDVPSPEQASDRRNISNESSQCEETFRPSFILKVFCFHWLVAVGLFTLGLYLTLKHQINCTGYNLIVYLQLGFWIGTYAVNDLIKPSCRKMLRQDYRLYRRLSIYRKRPLQIVSVWNTVLIATQEYVSNHYPQHESSLINGEECKVIWSTPQTFVVAFSGLQMLALTVFYVPAFVKLIGIACRVDPGPEFVTRSARLTTLEIRPELTIEDRLMQCAEQIKEIQRVNKKLRQTAKKLRINDDV
ncbi:hypothetical protein pipiens_017569 [Culex pipiens pipiens]|uniref:Transmembrane protein 192 n=1 Tax=Culex pipiens pipiens TaxID=38569 RepID=A0ABD1CFW5_CULPP